MSLINNKIVTCQKEQTILANLAFLHDDKWFSSFNIIMNNYLSKLSIVSFLSNIMIITVLYKMGMKNPTNVALMASSIADSITSLGAAIEFGLEDFIRSLYSNDCENYRMIKTMRLIIAGAQESGVWSTVLLAAQRYYFMTDKDTSDKYILIFIIISVNGPDLNGKCTYGNSLDIDHDIFWTIRNIVSLLIECVLPSIVLIRLNYLLFKTIEEAERRRERLLGLGKGTRLRYCSEPLAGRRTSSKIDTTTTLQRQTITESTLQVIDSNEMRPLQERRLIPKSKIESSIKEISKSRRTTLMLIFMVTVFLIVESPLLLFGRPIGAFHHLLRYFGYHHFLDCRLGLTRDATNKLWMLVSVIELGLILVANLLNFPIMFSMNTKFRSELKSILRIR